MSRACAAVTLVEALILTLISCGGGTSAPSPPPPPPSSRPTPTLLTTLYRFLNGSDRWSTSGKSERINFPLEAQTYYVAAQSATGRTALNRLVNSSGTDHADAVSGVSGYSQDMLLGYPWTSSVNPAMVQLAEAFNSSTGDYALLVPSETLSGYASQPLAAYGYPRYGGLSEVMLSLSAGGVTVESNEVAGGAVWRWYWNGTQFVNHADYGREIQDAFYFGTSPYNPTEAGDFFNFSDQSLKHGSPVIECKNQGTTQITRAIPLEWDPRQFSGDEDHPVIWDTLVLGKDLELNFNNLGPVAKYTSHLILPATSYGVFAMPAGYLNSNFNRYWTYDAKSKTLIEITSAMPDGCPALLNGSFGGYAFTVNFGGIIMADSAAATAMGIYGVSLSQGGSLSYFAMWKFFCWGDGPSETAGDNTAWSAVYGHGDDLLFPAGKSTYNVYIITDTLQNVTARMDDLYGLGVR